MAQVGYMMLLFIKSQMVYGAAILNKEDSSHNPLQDAQFRLQKKIQMVIM